MFTMRVDDQIELRLPDRYQLRELFHLAEANRDQLNQHMFWIKRCRTYSQMIELMREGRRDYARLRAVTAHIFYQGQAAGWVRLHSIDTVHRLGEVGYWVGATFQGKGIVTRAVRALLDYAFTTLRLNRVTLYCASDNPRSCAVAERLGFVHESVQAEALIMIQGTLDLHLYRLLAADWEPTVQRPDFVHRIDEHITLRPYSLAHAKRLFSLVDANRTHLRQWLNWVDGTAQVDDIRNFIRSGLDDFAEESGLTLGIWYDETLVGTIGLDNWNFDQGNAEVGYWLAADYQHAGIMTRSVQAVLRYAFEVLQFERIVLMCAVGNDKSCAIAQRLGFQHEGVLRGYTWLYDHYADMNVYALLAQDWTA